MDKIKYYKTVSVILLILLLAVSFYLAAGIKQLSGGESTGLYVALVVMFIIGLLLFVFNIRLTYNSGVNDNFISEQTKEELNSAAHKINSDKDVSSEEENILDVETYIKKIIPADVSTLTTEKFTEKILANLAKEFELVQGLFYLKENESGIFKIAGEYAYYAEERPVEFREGETLSGQVAKNKKLLNVPNIPENYITILSGLGSSSPRYLVILPVIVEDETEGIIEMASFKQFDSNLLVLFEKFTEIIGEHLTKVKKS
ncbi:MAG TPA: GAF domain-containing protein [Bacteroidales bacterium]|nr:GAF domain-containing protein [Bacteroidales bacterium]